MTLYREKEYWMLEHGRVQITLWLMLQMWGLNAHALARCCWLHFELGPIEFGWVR